MAALSMVYFTYVLRSRKDGKFYTGSTNNIDRRLKEHDRGDQKSTKSRRPFELVLKETYEIRTEAREREKYLKSGSGREFLKNKLNAPR